MNLNVRYLEEFVTLTEKKNFLEAAECLFISQSCLSKHIKKLETEIGVELFERTTRTVVLTEFGQMLLPYARKMVGLEYEFEKNVRRKIHQDSGNIVLGSIPSMKQHAITALIAGFLNENPDMTLQTIEGDSTFVKELLPEHSFINDLCIRECRNAGFEPHIAYTGNRGATLIDLVRNGAGITLMMHHSARQENDSSLAFIPVTPGIYSYISLNYAKEKPLSPQAKSFVRYVKAHKRDF